MGAALVSSLFKCYVYCPRAQASTLVFFILFVCLVFLFFVFVFCFAELRMFRIMSRNSEKYALVF